jgi:dipeptidyl aminopeptidase/acylaminoacyl peptidase
LSSVSSPSASAVENIFMFFPDNRAWSHQLIRVIGEINNGGGDFGEIFRAASKMKVGDAESWFSQWNAMAQYVENLGIEAEKRDHLVTARECYFRSSNYYRMADFYLDRYDAREKPTYLKHVSLFQKACALASPQIEPLSIPFEGVGHLHSYFVRSEKSPSDKLPCVILFGGADATCEEGYFGFGASIRQRDMHAVLLDGPGQGYTLRFEGLYARHDYEKAVGTVIDYLISEKEDFIQKDKIGIIGRSMGGYYAARAAAMEKRVRATVVGDAIFDVTSDVYDYFPPVRKAIQWDLGAKDDAEAREKLAKFNLSGIAEKIGSPILIIHGEQDYVSSPRAAKRLYDSINHDDKTLKWYKAGHGVSSYRAEAMELALDWLTEKLRK